MNARRALTWTIFWTSAAIALIALGWVSFEVVALERREAESRAQAGRQESIRRALWRLDSMMAPILAVESARSSYEFSSLQSQTKMGTLDSEEEEREKEKSFATSYFSLSDRSVEDRELWRQLQLPPVEINAYAFDSDELHADRAAREESSSSLYAMKAEDSDFDARNRIAKIATQNTQGPESAEPEALSVREQAQDLINQVEADRINESNDNALHFSRSSSPDLMTYDFSDAITQSNAGSLSPRWIRKDGQLTLVLVRDATVNGQPVVEGLELDWNALRTDLLRSIRDVLPDATLAPSNTTSLGAYRMATIPAVLVPPPMQTYFSWSWTPARAGLLMTWVAIIATIVAVGIVLRAAITLSERRGRFVSAVTHELRTPLTTFRLYSQMLADGMVSDEQVKAEYLTTLKRESERLTGIVENVLEYARITRVRLNKDASQGEQTLSPSALVARFRPGLARRLEQHNLDLVASLDLESHQDRTLHIDPHAVERIMMNLIENACKYAAPSEEEQGHEEHDTRVHLDVAVRNEYLELLVADHGPGIEPTERGRIFGEFQRGRRGHGNARSGLGLGLALSRGLAREMGGDLQFVRRRGHGAEFLFSLPLDPIQD